MEDFTRVFVNKRAAGFREWRLRMALLVVGGAVLAPGMLAQATLPVPQGNYTITDLARIIHDFAGEKRKGALKD